jgi:CDGSH-type Zn-finger protein
MIIEVMENGPYVVKGKNTIVDKDGNVTENEQDTYLCRCGASANKPYCDGAHREQEFDK